MTSEKQKLRSYALQEMLLKNYSEGREMILDENSDLWEEIKGTGNGKYVGKQKRIYILKISLKDIIV